VARAFAPDRSLLTKLMPCVVSATEDAVLSKASPPVPSPLVGEGQGGGYNNVVVVVVRITQARAEGACV